MNDLENSDELITSPEDELFLEFKTDANWRQLGRAIDAKQVEDAVGYAENILEEIVGEDSLKTHKDGSKIIVAWLKTLQEISAMEQDSKYSEQYEALLDLFPAIPDNADLNNKVYIESGLKFVDAMDIGRLRIYVNNILQTDHQPLLLNLPELVRKFRIAYVHLQHLKNPDLKQSVVTHYSGTAKSNTNLGDFDSSRSTLNETTSEDELESSVIQGWQTKSDEISLKLKLIEGKKQIAAEVLDYSEKLLKNRFYILNLKDYDNRSKIIIAYLILLRDITDLARKSNSRDYLTYLSTFEKLSKIFPVYLVGPSSLNKNFINYSLEFLKDHPEEIEKVVLKFFGATKDNSNLEDIWNDLNSNFQHTYRFYEDLTILATADPMP